MKLSRMIAVGAATALVGVSTLAIGGSAAAADSYVNDTQFPAETSPYSPGWFTGGGSTGTIDSTPSGLSLVGPYQILNGTTPSTGLVSLVADAELNVVSGEIAFQIPMFARGTANTSYTTLVPVDPGNAGLHRTTPGGWTSTNDILADDGLTILLDKDLYYTLEEIETALDTLADPYEILAFGAYLPLTKSAVVSSITWAGDTHWFLPAAPTATITPASITVADVSNSAKGVTGVFTGFVPNEAITIGLGTGQSGGQIDTATADANGVVTYKYVSAPADAAVGNYTLVAIGDVSGVSASGAFAVTANPAELAATGADFTPAIITGSLLLLLGGGFVIAARRHAIAKRH